LSSSRLIAADIEGFLDGKRLPGSSGAVGRTDSAAQFSEGSITVVIERFHSVMM